MKYSPLKDTFDMRSHSGAPEIASSVVGMNVDDLKDFCEEYMIDLRYSCVDRVKRLLTQDYHTERLNVEVGWWLVHTTADWLPSGCQPQCQNNVN